MKKHLFKIVILIAFILLTMMMINFIEDTKDYESFKDVPKEIYINHIYSFGAFFALLLLPKLYLKLQNRY